MVAPVHGASCKWVRFIARKQSCLYMKRPWFTTLAALLLGGLSTLGFAPFSVWPLTLLALIGLFFLWDGAGGKQAFWIGFLFGFGHFLSGTYWLYIALHTIGNAPIWLAVEIGRAHV